jgi:hypothetical protein
MKGSAVAFFVALRAARLRVRKTGSTAMLATTGR